MAVLLITGGLVFTAAAILGKRFQYAGEFSNEHQEAKGTGLWQSKRFLGLAGPGLVTVGIMLLIRGASAG